MGGRKAPPGIGGSAVDLVMAVYGVPVREALEDLARRAGIHDGAPVLLTYARSEDNGDFLTWTNEIALGTAKATGALLLPAAK